MNVRKPVDYGAMYHELAAILAQNLSQMDEIYAIGKIISQRPEKGAAVAAAEFLQANFPDRTGFSPRNVRRMRDFCKTYENDQTLLRLAMKIGWTLNVAIMEAELTRDVRKWYLGQAREQQWSKAILLEKLASTAHLEKTLDVKVDSCYTVIGITKDTAIKIDGAVIFDWEVTLISMDSNIWGDIIGGVATIVSAIISVGYLEKIIHKEIVPSFFSYSEPRHNLWHLLRTAENEVTIVVAYGVHLLETHRSHLLYLLKKGIKIRYLMLKPKEALEMGEFLLPAYASSIAHIRRQREIREEIESVLDNLAKLQSSAPYGNMKIQMTDIPLTASYIAVDIARDMPKYQYNAIIQMMVYQFNVIAEHLPISYLSLKNAKEQFESTAKSINEIWDISQTVDIVAYRKALQAMFTDSFTDCYTYEIEEIY